MSRKSMLASVARDLARARVGSDPRPGTALKNLAGEDLLIGKTHEDPGRESQVEIFNRDRQTRSFMTPAELRSMIDDGYYTVVSVRRDRGRDPIAHTRTLVVRGRTYSVEAHVVPAGRPFAGEPRYTLTGKRGATYFTTRNVHRPHLMFIFSNAPRSNVLEGVWLTDEGGELRVVRQ